MDRHQAANWRFCKIRTMREFHLKYSPMLHWVVTSCCHPESAVPLISTLVCWKENILKNEVGSVFWRKSSRFVKVVSPSASERTFSSFSAFWGDFGASPGYLSRRVFLCLKMIFDFESLHISYNILQDRWKLKTSCFDRWMWFLITLES